MDCVAVNAPSITRSSVSRHLHEPIVTLQQSFSYVTQTPNAFFWDYEATVLHTMFFKVCKTVNMISSVTVFFTVLSRELLQTRDDPAMHNKTGPALLYKTHFLVRCWNHSMRLTTATPLRCHKSSLRTNINPCQQCNVETPNKLPKASTMKKASSSHTYRFFFCFRVFRRFTIISYSLSIPSWSPSPMMAQAGWMWYVVAGVSSWRASCFSMSATGRDFGRSCLFAMTNSGVPWFSANLVTLCSSVFASSNRSTSTESTT